MSSNIPPPTFVSPKLRLVNTARNSGIFTHSATDRIAPKDLPQFFVITYPSVKYICSLPDTFIHLTGSLGNIL